MANLIASAARRSLGPGDPQLAQGGLLPHDTGTTMDELKIWLNWEGHYKRLPLRIGQYFTVYEPRIFISCPTCQELLR